MGGINSDWKIQNDETIFSVVSNFKTKRDNEMTRILELERCGIECGSWDFKLIEGYNHRRMYCIEAKKEIPVPSERVDGFPIWCPLKKKEETK